MLSRRPIYVDQLDFGQLFRTLPYQFLIHSRCKFNKIKQKSIKIWISLDWNKTQKIQSVTYSLIARISSSLFAKTLTSSDIFLSASESLLPYRVAKNSNTYFRSGNSILEAISGIVSTSVCKSGKKQSKCVKQPQLKAPKNSTKCLLFTCFTQIW